MESIEGMGGCKTLIYMCETETEEGGPRILKRMDYWCKQLILTFIGFGSFLMLSMFFSCCLIYSLGTGKQGKKGAGAMCYRMFCPCLREKRYTPEHKRLRASEMTAGSDDEDY